MHKKIGDEFGFFMVQLKNNKLNNDEKKQLVNDMLKIYSSFLFTDKKESHVLAELKVLENKLSLILETIEI